MSDVARNPKDRFSQDKAHIITVTSACDTCLEMGAQFALHVPEKALYFQADLVKDTDRMFHMLQTTAKVCILCLRESSLLSS